MNMQELPRALPSDEGVSRVSVDAFVRALERTEARMRGFVLLRHGRVVAEKYWAPYTAENKNWVYSASKSFTATAVGMAYDEGLLRVEDKVLSFFPEIETAGLGEYAKAMRVRDLLCMASGHGEDTIFSLLFAGAGNWEKAFFSQPVDHEPGRFFVYNSGGSFMLSSIISRVTGKSVIEYLREKLFEPLGFGGVDGDLNPDGVFTGGWGLLVRLEDLAKLGQLYLNGGLWEGRRLLSREWVAMATAWQSDNARPGRENEPPDWRQGYGFQFWLCQNGAFRADGAAGQYCVVLPAQDAVLALMSEIADMQEILDAVWDTLLPGLSNTASPCEAMIGNKEFRLQGGSEGMKTARFAFTRDSLTLTMEGGGETCSIKSGRGNWKDGVCTLPFGAMSMVPMFALEDMPKQVSSCFHWVAPDTLEIRWVYLETPHRERLTCKFEGNEAAFFLCSSAYGNYSDAQELDDPDFIGQCTMYNVQ